MNRKNYFTPELKIHSLGARLQFLTGSYGEGGEAGAGFDNDNTNEYEDL